MRVLVDTSVWIDHLHTRNDVLGNLLREGLVCIHPVIIGELACGAIKDRKRFLDLLMELPRLPENTFEEVIATLETYRWWGKGLGWSDVQLLATATASTVAGESRLVLWTKDRALDAVARTTGVSFKGG